MGIVFIVAFTIVYDAYPSILELNRPQKRFFKKKSKKKIPHSYAIAFVSTQNGCVAAIIQLLHCCLLLSSEKCYQTRNIIQSHFDWIIINCWPNAICLRFPKDYRANSNNWLGRKHNFSRAWWSSCRHKKKVQLYTVWVHKFHGSRLWIFHMRERKNSRITRTCRENRQKHILLNVNGGNFFYQEADLWKNDQPDKLIVLSGLDKDQCFLSYCYHKKMKSKQFSVRMYHGH